MTTDRWRVLHGACLSSIRRPGDFEYADSALPLGPLNELVGALTPEQKVSLALVALADLAVWPQLEQADTEGVLTALRAKGESTTFAAHPNAKSSPGLVALGHVSAFLNGARASAADRTQSPPTAESLHAAVECLGRTFRQPARYWEDWLIRVVPCAADISTEQAYAFAVKASECQLTVPGTYAYEVSVGENEAAAVHVVTPRMGGKIVATLGYFENYVPKSRVVRARFVPHAGAESIDAYRMGYLFQTSLMGTFFQGDYEGRYDNVSITHATTGETFDYESL